MIVIVVFEEDVLRLICAYARQNGRRYEEKQSYYDELKGEWDIHSAGDLFMCLDDINGHVGRHIDGWLGWCRPEELGRKNVIRALYG